MALPGLELGGGILDEVLGLRTGGLQRLEEVFGRQRDPRAHGCCGECTGRALLAGCSLYAIYLGENGGGVDGCGGVGGVVVVR